jgi:hypothetical protein
VANNTQQIFSKAPRINWCSLTAANTAMDGTGTVGTIFTASGANDSRCDRIRAMPQGTNVASVARIFINNGSTNATAANNTLIAEMALPATTASNSAPVGPSPPVELPIAADINALFPNGLPNGYKVNVAMGTAVSAGWDFTGLGGDY